MVRGFLILVEGIYMNTKSLISLTEQNIRQALADYRKHTYSTAVLDDVSDDFIRKLGRVE